MDTSIADPAISCSILALKWTTLWRWLNRPRLSKSKAGRRRRSLTGSRPAARHLLLAIEKRTVMIWIWSLRTLRGARPES